ncbi:hypothetical protein F511_03169 [Dorcoceras hygrometricum]|nr:hypothetical protein F511_03169 [Dorcoceras hygrometricum]
MARSGGARRNSGSFCYREVLPFTAIVVIECTNVGLNTLYKLATRSGMSRHVFVVYAYAIAALVLLPSPFLSRRSRALPPLNRSILLKIILLGIIGYSSQIMGYTGINYSSPTLASAMSNLVPAFTFVLAVIFRMEKVELSSRSSKAKIVGSVVSISGAIVVTLYKGLILFTSTHYTRVSLLSSLQSNWMMGSLFLAVEYSLVPLWYIVMTQILKEYPAELTLVFAYTLCVSILGGIVGFFVEPDSSKWRITPSVALASFLCSGIFGCCLNNAVHAWALHVRGPVYVAMFKPLSIAIAAAMGVIILGDTLYLGSVIGATIIAIGFYTVMWGKSKEEMIGFDETGDLESPSSTLKHPILQTIELRNWLETMGDDKDAFYVVRKGNTVGVYKSISDLQSVLRSSVNDPSVSVFKGFGLSREAEEYLSSHGLGSAIYSIEASAVKDDLFGQLATCPFREPNNSKDKSVSKNHLEKRPQIFSTECSSFFSPLSPSLSTQLEVAGSASFASHHLKSSKLDNFLQVQPVSSYCSSCILEFDGASKGNPGPAGAGAVLRAADGNMVFRVREGVGIATNNVAEYRGAILGLKYALQKGFKHIRVQGDSKLVCMQVQGLWKTKNQNMAELCKVARELKDQFMSFEICHIEREYNTEADSQANLAVHLKGNLVYLLCSSFTHLWPSLVRHWHILQWCAVGDIEVECDIK